jgi:hypothetical protein
VCPWLAGSVQGLRLLILLSFPVLASLAQIRFWKQLAPLSAAANVMIISGEGAVLSSSTLLAPRCCPARCMEPAES